MISYSNVNITTDSFGQWLDKFNFVLVDLRTKIVTTDSNTTPGNAAITGLFTANSVFANTTILAGALISVGNSTVNSNFTATNIVVGNSSSNTTILRDAINIGSNVTITPTSLVIGNSTVNTRVQATFISTTTPAIDSNTNIVATTAFVLGQGSNTNPLVNAVAAQGTSNRFSRQDHVHPTDTTVTTDTSRAALTGAAFTGTISAPGLFMTAQGETEGGQINIQRGLIGNTLAGDLIVDSESNRFRIFEAGGTFRGVHFDLTGCDPGAGSALWHTGNLTPANYLPLSGGNLTGPVVITAPAAGIVLSKTIATNTAFVLGRNGPNPRFQMQLANGALESGGNSGSDFSVDRFDDAGQYLASPLNINRASGNVTVGAGGGQLILGTEGSAVNAVMTKAYIDNRTAALFGGETSNQFTIRNNAPTISLVDTDNRSGILHVNSGIMHFLRGGVNSAALDGVNLPNGRWPLESNLNNGNLAIAGNITIGGNAIFPGSGAWITIADALHVNGQLNTAHVHSRGDIRAEGSISCPHQITCNVSQANFTNSNGDVHAGSNMLASNYFLRSDRALKENIRTLDGALGIISNLRGVRFALKADGKPQVGLIAQEVKEVMPELVIGEEGSMGVSYMNLVAVLIEAVKEMQSKIVRLEEHLSQAE